MAPPARIVPRLGSHRYGGAFDLTLVDAKGKELDMGVPVDYVAGPEAQLLFYEFIAKPSAKEIRARDNRRILIKAMTVGGFDPYLEEFWHWNYLGDVTAAAREWQRKK
jgi:D-alanyl-D-alanine dipeptidase